MLIVVEPEFRMLDRRHRNRSCCRMKIHWHPPFRLRRPGDATSSQAKAHKRNPSRVLPAEHSSTTSEKATTNSSSTTWFNMRQWWFLSSFSNVVVVGRLVGGGWVCRDHPRFPSTVWYVRCSFLWLGLFFRLRVSSSSIYVSASCSRPALFFFLLDLLRAAFLLEGKKRTRTRVGQQPLLVQLVLVLCYYY
jgi:hypothetical protein